MISLIRVFAIFALMLGLHGCAGFGPEPLKPGTATASEVRDRFGTPDTERTNDDGSVTWEYPTGPAGVHCRMITLSANGVLQKIEQVLTEENFARIEKGWSIQQVRRLLGKPTGINEFPRMPEVVWEWHIEAMTPGYTAFFHVHLSPDGKVKHTSRREEAPDHYSGLR